MATTEELTARTHPALQEAWHNYDTAWEYRNSLPNKHPDLERAHWNVRTREMLLFVTMSRLGLLPKPPPSET